MSYPRLTSAPTTPPVTLTDLKEHLRVDGTSLDAMLTAKLAEATEIVERSTARKLITGTYSYVLDTFPCSDDIEIPIAPLAGVSAITYTDQAGTTNTLAPSVYYVNTNEEPGEIELKYGQVWPTTSYDPGSVTITFTAGYGTSAPSVPATLQAAVKMLAGHLLEQTDASITGTIIAEVPLGVERMLNLYRWGRYP